MQSANEILDEFLTEATEPVPVGAGLMARAARQAKEAQLKRAAEEERDIKAMHVLIAILRRNESLRPRMPNTPKPAKKKLVPVTTFGEPGKRKLVL